MQESALVEGLRNMDPEMFRELVSRYQQPLVRLCRGFLHNEEDARDTAQETFLEVVESIRDFRADARLSTWIYRIAVNKCLNQVRRNKLRNTFTLPLPFHFDDRNGLLRSEKEGWYDPDDSLEKIDRKRRIRKAMDSLPGNQKIAFILNKYMDLGYKEIAAVMDISLPAVESLIHRAKTRLQEKLFRLYKKNLL